MSSKIEWTEETWNPITGCTKVSPGCANCYAERMARRLAGRVGYPEAPHHFDVTLHPERLDQPFRWKKPRRVFVCSMSDLFHRDVPGYFLAHVFNIMLRTPRHTYQVLTKRADLMHDWCKHDYTPPNVWLGVTAENPRRADERIPYLLRTPAAVRFVSIEPMLGPVDLVAAGGIYNGSYPGLDWVIVGCESGPRRRVCDIEWVRELVRECRDAHLPVFVKQLDIDGHVSKDPNEWPEDLRVREYPTRKEQPND